MAILGGCQCGEVRYELSAPPDRVAVCHCRDCQKSSGAPMVAWAVMPKEVFRITRGEARAVNSSGDSFRYFCGACGTGLYYINETFLPGLIDVQAMTLDDPGAFSPGAQVQLAEAAPWAARLHEIPAFARYPGMDAPESGES
ncbi:GFA family protein [Hyphomonas sp.]|uniref:GFA family protein n=1 Tax=Hyphomonas sp. TaxID=87 RepID=UPI00391B2935